MAGLFFSKQEEWASWTASQARVIHPQRDAVSGELTRQKEGGPRRQRGRRERRLPTWRPSSCPSGGGREGRRNREPPMLDSKAGPRASSDVTRARCRGPLAPHVPTCTAGRDTKISKVPSSTSSPLLNLGPRAGEWTCLPSASLAPCGPETLASTRCFLSPSWLIPQRGLSAHVRWELHSSSHYMTDGHFPGWTESPRRAGTVSAFVLVPGTEPMPNASVPNMGLLAPASRPPRYEQG